MEWKEIKAGLKEVARDNREERRAVNRKTLDESGEAFTVANNGEVYLFRKAGRRADFFISSGRWRDLGGQRTLSGGAEKFLEWYRKGGKPAAKETPPAMLSKEDLRRYAERYYLTLDDVTVEDAADTDKGFAETEVDNFLSWLFEVLGKEGAA